MNPISSVSQINNSIQNLSSGKNMNKAGALNAQRSESQSRMTEVGVSNTALAMAKFSQSSNALNAGSKVLSRMSELASQAADPTLSDTDRSALNIEANALKDELGDLMGSTNFNGQSVLDGGATTTQNGEDRVSAQDGNGSTVTTALTGLDLSTQAGAQAAIDQIKQASQSLSKEQAVVGSSLDKLGRASSLAQTKAANLQSVASQANGTDAIAEIGKLQKYVQQQEISNAVESMKNDQLKSLDAFMDDD